MTKLFYFQETRLFVSTIKDFDELHLPKSLILFAEIFHTFPTAQCLLNGDRDFCILFGSSVINKNVKKPDFL